ETDVFPSLWRRVPGVEVVAVPVPDGADGEATGIIEQLRRGALRRFDEADLGRFYIRTLQQRAAEFGRAAATLGGVGALPAVVHCAAGKDRSGLLVALVLTACGVERADVLDDFALTSRYRGNRLDDFRVELERLGTVPEDIAAVFACPPEALAAALESVEQRHGSVEAYLAGPGAVPGEALTRLRAGLTAPG
ncbi:MAG TPA: tyrosine-protein phosphatase, partial [Acidimicrobiia bacterium]|nr:tyrosine-protein phosphatase [Acidimicrobiia bacterium]